MKPSFESQILRNLDNLGGPWKQNSSSSQTRQNERKRKANKLSWVYGETKDDPGRKNILEISEENWHWFTDISSLQITKEGILLSSIFKIFSFISFSYFFALKNSSRSKSDSSVLITQKITAFIALWLQFSSVLYLWKPGFDHTYICKINHSTSE